MKVGVLFQSSGLAILSKSLCSNVPVAEWVVVRGDGFTVILLVECDSVVSPLLIQE